MHGRPLIGVVPLYDREKDSYWMLPGYFDGIEEAGGIPLMLPMTADGDAFERLVLSVDGVLLTGGQDVSPELYGESAKETCGEVCPARDAMEPRLAETALRLGRPILGICRGIQLLNVCLGGTLYQDLPTELEGGVSHHMEPPYDRAEHTVKIAEGSPLAEVLGETEIGVNSCHHQGVKRLAPALEAMARAEDGLVEAVYMPSEKFVWAVQWHPEFSHKNDAHSRMIFRAFVEAAVCTADR